MASRQPAREKRKLSGSCHFKAAWRSQTFTMTVGGAKKTLSGEVLFGVEGEDNVKCTACGVTFSVRHGGANDVVKHFSTQNHYQCYYSISDVLL